MTDIFFSYRSTDRERIRPIRDAFAKQGFDVFWDQEVPTGGDWDSSIRQHLTKSKCVVVFWSIASVASHNVRHEATVANLQGKLIQVMLEPLTPEQFPMGLYSQQAIDLSDWGGEFDYAERRKLSRDIEGRLMPSWVRQQIFELEAELVAERARREGVESRDRVLQAQIAKEVQAQAELKQQRNQATDEATALRATVAELRHARSELEVRATRLSQQLLEIRATGKPTTEKNQSSFRGPISGVGQASTSRDRSIVAVMLLAMGIFIVSIVAMGSATGGIQVIAFFLAFFSPIVAIVCYRML